MKSEELTQAEKELREWATGQRSWTNILHPDLAAIATADAAEIERRTAAVMALRLLEQSPEPAQGPDGHGEAHNDPETVYRLIIRDKAPSESVRAALHDLADRWPNLGPRTSSGDWILWETDTGWNCGMLTVLDKSEIVL